MSGLPEIDGVTDLTEIGRGGFGVVYRGTETEFGRDVAIKVLMPTLDERARLRFERERRAMGAVSDHQNIVTVYRGGLTGASQPYLVMEYLRGGSLDDRLRSIGPLDWREAASIGAKLSDALAVAHRAGILHRDVKPGNVFQTETGEPKLGDFGIARLDDGQDSRTGSITASVAHAPPEIVDGQRGDERSDLYSLASTIYALTMGAAPFSRDPDQGLASLLARVSKEPPPLLHLESAADEFERILLKALSKDPQDRHATMIEFGNELRRAALAPITRPLHDATTSVTAGGAAQPLATSEVQIEPAPEPKRATSSSQIAMMALLALAVAGFGGWAVARAVLNSDDDPTERTAVVAGIEDPTSVGEPTTETVATATTAPEPTNTPATEPTTAPTRVPTTEPTPAPTATPTTLGGGSRGSGLGSTIDGYSPVADFSGAISLQVPNAWAFTVQDGATIPLETQGLDALRVLAVGGSFAQLNGDVETRDLATSGIYIFAARVGAGANSQDIVDVALAFWTDCVTGDQSQILLMDGLAEYQILQCVRADGGMTGVVVLGLVPDDDPEVAVSVFLQYAELADLESLPTIMSTLNIDASQVPAAT